MSDLPASQSELTLLSGPQPGPLSDQGLGDLYAWPPVDGAWVRTMMLFSLDGAVRGATGTSRSISSDLDRRILTQVRRDCDAVLIGAGTFRAERYRPFGASSSTLYAQRSPQRSPLPRLVIVSNSLELPWDEDAFSQKRSRAIVLTSAAGAALDGGARLRAAAQFADVIQAGQAQVDPTQAIAALTELGLPRIVCEGGPGLLSALARADLIDEVCSTLAPLIVDGGQITTGTPLAQPLTWRPASVVLGADGFIFLRYLRSRTALADLTGLADRAGQADLADRAALADLGQSADAGMAADAEIGSSA